MRYSHIAGALILGIIVGCDQASTMKAMTPAEDEQAARTYLKLLQDNKFEEVEKDLDPGIKTPNSRDLLKKMAALIPAEAPRSVKVVGSNAFRSQGLYKSNITFEYQFPNKWLLANVAIQKKGSVSTIVGLHVNPIPDSLENLNRFKLPGKNVVQYGVLALVALVPLFTLYVLVLCIRTEIPKRKWLWIIFILLSVGKFTVNWTTGQWNFMPLAVQLFGGGAFAPLYGAWILSVSLPLGAFLFLLRRKGFSKVGRAETRQGHSAALDGGS